MRRLGILAATAFLAVAGTATAANAAVSAPSVNLDCESGLNRYLCSTVLSGGAPTSIRWSVNGIPMPAWDGRRATTGPCTASTVVSVTVSNSAGSDSASWRGCRSGPWL
ncbi:hypothetical protein KOI35_28290 [Actinoplanes bogorensis]|uniref:Ig-like domain-containing protein n=1 Tax=Paractinoplanes bogorensis TaxID=1610840 RepID=A0ABS5YVM6_9ACTN|nr:hypothetical protein [Actinoplanes bogorensis]MBU2667418.1 hypothetical protein [Actinoplanes bogorensis]